MFAKNKFDIYVDFTRDIYIQKTSSRINFYQLLQIIFRDRMIALVPSGIKLR